MSTLSIHEDDTLGEVVHRYELPSGLRVLVHVKPWLRKRFALLGADFGSVDTAFLDIRDGRRVDVPEGVAHFLEHGLLEKNGRPVFDAFLARTGIAARAKQAWTDVAQFSAVGVPAVNFGPGDPGLAHRDDERVRPAALARCFEVLERFLSGGGSP